MFAGHTLAMVIGVPLGTYLGNSFGWRLPFFLIAGIACGAVIALGKWLPSTPSQRRTSAWEQLSILANPAILTMMAVTILGFGASFAPFSFIAPLLVNVAGITAADVNLLLVVFGLATLLGNIAGGSAASKIGWQKTLGLMFCALAIVLFGISVFLHHSIVVSLTVFFWGGLAFGMSPACQAGMLSVAERYTPTAVDFASSLNISAFNLGISLGEASGGVMVSNHRLAQTPLLGVVLVLTALIPLQRISYRSRTAP
jgi:predicted MFS family arabinose efflux permease